MIAYSLTGIDDDGNPVVELDITAEHAATIMLDMVQKGLAKITMQGTISKLVEKAVDILSEPEEAPTGKRKYTKRSELKPLKVKRLKGCNTCGSKSWRHFKGCKFEGVTKASREGDGHLPANDKRTGALTKEKFEQVKIAKSHGLDASSIAGNMPAPLREVERAISAKTYVEYAA